MSVPAIAEYICNRKASIQLLKIREYSISCLPIHRSITGTLCPAFSIFVSHSCSITFLIPSCTSTLANIFCAWYGPNVLARTAADNKAFTWLNMNTYAVCCKVIPSIHVITPNRGPRCAETGGRSLEVLELAERRSAENSFRASTAEAAAPTGIADRNDFSHIESNALPCAIEARRPTVQIICAS